MTARRRELDIFGLSMLNVVCCALGAFLVLVLAAAPSSNNASPQAATPSAGARTDNQLLFMSSWELAGTDFDLWVMKPDKSWAGPRGRRLFNRITPNYEFDNVDGTAKDTTWFETYRRTDPEAGAYVIVGQLFKAPPGAAGVDLRGFAAIDLRSVPYQSQAAIKPVRYREGDVRVNAIVSIERAGRARYFEYEEPWDGGAWPSRVQAKLDELAAGK